MASPNGCEEHSQKCTSQDEGDVFNFMKPNFEKKVIAKMPVLKDEMFYNMNHKKRGMAVIFNHEKFDIEKLRPRSGTDVDAKNLKSCLAKLGFQVVIHQDLKTRRILEEVQKGMLPDIQF